MSYLDNLKKRLGSLGGSIQIDRMNKDKLKSLKRAIDYSYQSATITNESGNSFKCLMNPNKLSNDYDIKIISIPYKDYKGNILYGSITISEFVCPTNAFCAPEQLSYSALYSFKIR